MILQLEEQIRVQFDFNQSKQPSPQVPGYQTHGIRQVGMVKALQVRSDCLIRPIFEQTNQHLESAGNFLRTFRIYAMNRILTFLTGLHERNGLGRFQKRNRLKNLYSLTGPASLQSKSPILVYVTRSSLLPKIHLPD